MLVGALCAKPNMNEYKVANAHHAPTTVATIANGQKIYATTPLPVGYAATVGVTATLGKLTMCCRATLTAH